MVNSQIRPSSAQKPKYNHGNQVVFSCANGYIPEGANLTRTCRNGTIEPELKSAPITCRTGKYHHHHKVAHLAYFMAEGHGVLCITVSSQLLFPACYLGRGVNV